MPRWRASWGLNKSMSRRKLKIAKRKAAQLHSLSVEMEAAFAEIEQGKPARAESTAVARTLPSDARSDARPQTHP